MKKATKTSNVNKLIYTVEDSQEVIPVLSNIVESLVDSSETKISSDSLKMMISQKIKKKMQEEAKYPTEIKFEITKDGWIKQRFIKNKLTYCFKHFIKNDSIIVYDSNKVNIITSYKKTTDNCLCKITIDKSKTKDIFGYECYYVKAEEVCSNTDSKETLTANYEMYVTEKIHLPMYAILENDCELSGYFPLEVKCFLSNEFYYRYKLTRIE